MDKVLNPRVGFQTGNNNKYLRQWYEVSYPLIDISQRSVESAAQSTLKWFPYNKGGTYRKWYGNEDYVIKWSNNSFDLKQDLLKRKEYPI